MSSRERWTIYPLLFMALCLGARDQFDPLKPETTKFQKIVCDSLQANNVVYGRALVVLAPDSLESDPREVVKLQYDPLEQAGVVEILSNEGDIQTKLGSTLRGGLIETHNSEGMRHLLIGSPRELSARGIYVVGETGRILPYEKSPMPVVENDAETQSQVDSESELEKGDQADDS